MLASADLSLDLSAQGGGVFEMGEQQFTVGDIDLTRKMQPLG